MARQDGDLHRRIAELGSYLASTRDVAKVLGHALRMVRERFEADQACLAVARPGAQVELTHRLPEATAGGGAPWDLGLLDDFVRGRHPAVPWDTLVAPVRRHGRPWAVLALRRAGAPFARGTGRELNRLCEAVTRLLGTIDRERVLAVRERIDRKLMEQLRPRDLFYQILHGLRSLTGYDHSSALLVAEQDASRLRLEAEQIAWLKGKSDRINQVLPLGKPCRQLLEAGRVCGYDRLEGEWRSCEEGTTPELAALLEYRGPGQVPPEGALLAAPLAHGGQLLGVLKIASREPGSFGRYEAELVEHFLPHVAIAIRNSWRTESLHHRMVEAERQQVMAELARGVSHDVNNALGAILPLVQQMQEEVQAGRMDRELFEDDLRQVLTSLQVCRRIFGGMLSFARGRERETGYADVERAARAALTILEDGMQRRGIRIELALDPGTRHLEGRQGDLEQLFLNLLSNARDAMPEGGTLKVTTASSGRQLRIHIEDTGSGIPEEHLPRIQEAFFTTKPKGNGLGLSICRSIVWEMNGKLGIQSRLGQGTRVTVELPLTRARLRDQAGEP